MKSHASTSFAVIIFIITNIIVVLGITLRFDSSAPSAR
jgi:hypothetical protein